MVAIPLFTIPGPDGQGTGGLVGVVVQKPQGMETLCTHAHMSTTNGPSMYWSLLLLMF